MKKIILIALSVFMIFVSYSCKHADSQTSGSYNQSQLNYSAIKLLKESFNSNQVDTVISGLSADIAIDMLANGVRGKSLKQLESFFNTTLENKNNELRRKFRTVSKSLEISNSIWGNNFKESYKILIKEIFNAVALPLPENTSTINDWIATKTHGRISSLFNSEATDPLSLYLINTVYFKDNWSTLFEKRKTREKRFYSLSGKGKDVQMMRKQDRILYAQNSKVQSVRLMYENGGYMSIYLPKETENFSKFISDLSEKDLDLNYTYQKVSLLLPKFKVDSEINIKQIFKNLGIDEIFNVNNNDLTKMTQPGAYVQDIKQKATVEVNEEGTEATSSTGVQVMAKGIEYYIPVEVNRPFLFVVSEGDFIGVYTGN